MFFFLPLCLFTSNSTRSILRSRFIVKKKKRAAVALAHNSVITQRTSHFFFSSFLREKVNRRKHDNRTPQGTTCDYGVTVFSSLFFFVFFFTTSRGLKTLLLEKKKKSKRKLGFSPLFTLSKSGGHNHVCARVRDCHHWKQKAKRAEAQPKIRESRNTQRKKGELTQEAMNND